MGDPLYIKKRKFQRAQTKVWLCGACFVMKYRKQIAVAHGKRRGLCRTCVARQCTFRNTADLSSYWTRDWPAALIKPVGGRRTWNS